MPVGSAALDRILATAEEAAVAAVRLVICSRYLGPGLSTDATVAALHAFVIEAGQAHGLTASEREGAASVAITTFNVVGAAIPELADLALHVGAADAERAGASIQ